MKIGIFGGTFNPPHLGHLTAARAAVTALDLERLLLIPDRVPPHKPLPEGSPTAEQRLWMTQRTGEELDGTAETLDVELLRPGPSYTSDTLTALRTRYPRAELWLLVGMDMFQTFPDWHEPETILSLSGIAAFARTADPAETSLEQQRAIIHQKYPDARIATITIPDVQEISSTELRRCLSEGKGSEYLVPAVYGYILREGLYGTKADLKHLSLEQLRFVALSYLKRSRIPHVLGTEQAAQELALRYGADVEQARRAALLHDCTKKLSMDEQLALCRQYGIALDDLERVTPKLLHAKTGAAIARDVFGADDEICNAILWHTTGHAGMTRLEKIIYLADYIECTRNFPGVEQPRVLSQQSLDAAVCLGLRMSVEDLESQGEAVHRNTLEALNDLERNGHQ